MHVKGLRFKETTTKLFISLIVCKSATSERHADRFHELNDETDLKVDLTYESDKS